MPSFFYQTPFPLGPDALPYRKLSDSGIERGEAFGEPVLRVKASALTLLAREAFSDVSFLCRPKHLEQLRRIIDDPEASQNDAFVALEMLKNAVIASDKIFPMCQDTGTATVVGKKGHRILSGFGLTDEEALSKGIFETYTQKNLRYSQLAPLSLFEEKNTGCNLPAQIDIQNGSGASYDFLFIAKGGGSANKSFLFQETKAILNRSRLLPFLKEKITGIGTSACPPYHLAIVIGGSSAEATLKTVKMASAGYLDTLPSQGNAHGHAFRDRGLEEDVLQVTSTIGLGAQFGGKYFCHDVRVVRLPRHGASCPVGIGVSCSADRNIKGKITADGVFLEQLEENPARFLPQPSLFNNDSVAIDLNRPMDEVLAELTKYPVGTRLSLSGDLIVARDIAHAKLAEEVDKGGDLPAYFKNHIIYYAGPAKTPEGYPSGSFGPTTAGRMDLYVDAFQQLGGSRIMLAKGNRSAQVKAACCKNGGFYLGSMGGPAARIGRDCITRVETLAYPELGMEAVYTITVNEFPAFIIIDDKGHDFYQEVIQM
ncbi:FumA C-terminus/TtdB family hydratase beta subunit [Desulfoluna spongiiphila]|uniref:Fumarate hydratase class I n=1 Tax=Desulfoluna spongiiphila TaxID=419481 RepID=A0A1G5CQ74_9BACT|nr:FumA C-terminus/TtdB family hydratase beta subunit [Desulfoluna spongiiphila]SCY04400.1 fumarase, class I, homodimeric [Desulfoluna spongiiphila]